MIANGDCTVYRPLKEGGYLRVELRQVNWQQEEGSVVSQGRRPSSYLRDQTRVFVPFDRCPQGFRPRTGDLFLRGICPIPGDRARRETLLGWQEGRFSVSVIRRLDNGPEAFRHWEAVG